MIFFFFFFTITDKSNDILWLSIIVDGENLSTRWVVIKIYQMHKWTQKKWRTQRNFWVVQPKLLMSIVNGIREDFWRQMGSITVSKIVSLQMTLSIFIGWGCPSIWIISNQQHRRWSVVRPPILARFCAECWLYGWQYGGCQSTIFI